jgi:hypothetical protein
MENWPLRQHLHDVVTCIKIKSVVEMHRRFRHEFGLEGI